MSELIKEIRFTIPGEPNGKGRPRFARIGTFTKTYTPKKTVMYENLVKMEYEQSTHRYRFSDEAYIDMRIRAYYGIPKSVSKIRKAAMIAGILRPVKKPDADNVLKSVADSLNEVAYHDDSQIVDCQVRKFYSENPRVEVRIRDVREYDLMTALKMSDPKTEGGSK